MVYAPYFEFLQSVDFGELGPRVVRDQNLPILVSQFLSKEYLQLSYRDAKYDFDEYNASPPAIAA